MNIIAFNVNGLRAILQKDFAKNIARLDPDILVIEETKLSEEGPAAFPFTPEGYHVYWSVSKVKKGYSGVAILSKSEPLTVHYGLEEGAYDEEGRVITLEFPSFYLVGVYVPNSGEELKRLSFRMEFEDRLLAYLRSLDAKKPLILSGDLNVAHEEIDIKNPKDNIHNAGFTPEERAKFSRLLSAGFVDTYRRMYPEKIEYSWWSYRFHARENNAGWRIDYFLVSERLFSHVEDSLILTTVMGSDHCPIELRLKD